MNEAAANLSGFPKEYAFLLLGIGLGFFLGWLGPVSAEWGGPLRGKPRVGPAFPPMRSPSTWS